MKLLIELPTWLGDCVMTTPAIENIINFYDDMQITFIGSSVSIEALKSHPKSVKTLVLDKKYSALYRTTQALGEFDVFFSFRSSIRSKFLKFFIASKKKYQFDKHRYQNRHQVEKYNDFVNDSLNISNPAGMLSLPVQKPQKNTKKTLGINPGASYGSAKRWYPDEFAKVASALSSQYDIVIFGGSNEKEFAADIEKLLIKNGVKNYQNLAAKTTTGDLIKYIAGLDLFITGDSGPMHVAAAFQVPTVAIFGPTKDDETAQWMNEKSAIVKENLICQPCMKRVCPLKGDLHHQCMKNIEAQQVLTAIENL